MKSMVKALMYKLALSGEKANTSWTAFLTVEMNHRNVFHREIHWGLLNGEGKPHSQS